MNGIPVSMLLFLVLQLLFLACIFWVMPSWSRMEHFFSVTVPRDFRVSDEGRAVLAGYRGGVLISALIGLVALVASTRIAGETSRMVAMICSTSLIGLVGFAVAYLRARGKTLPHAVAPSHIREAALSSGVADSLTRGQWIAFLVPIGLLVVTIAALIGIYPSLSDRIVTHFNASGEPDAWADKSMGMLLFPPGLALIMSISLVFVTRWILRSLPVRTAEPEALDLENKRRGAIVELMIVVNGFLAAVFILVAAAMVTPPNIAKVLAIVALVSCFLMGTGLMIWFLIRHGKVFTASSRGAETGQDGTPIGDRTEDRHWKAGMIYYNPEDPAVWVEKRIGIGYTTNMARSEAWVMLGGIFVFVGLVIAAAFAFGGG